MPIGKTPNQIPKIRGIRLCWKYVVAFPEEGAPQTHWDTLPRLRSPQSPQCLDQCRALDASNASTHSNFFPLSTISTYVKRARDVLVRPDCNADCRNSVRRNRVCRNSVCLTINRTATSIKPPI